jgi:hypothetical protein
VQHSTLSLTLCLISEFVWKRYNDKHPGSAAATYITWPEHSGLAGALCGYSSAFNYLNILETPNFALFNFESPREDLVTLFFSSYNYFPMWNLKTGYNRCRRYRYSKLPNISVQYHDDGRPASKGHQNTSLRWFASLYWLLHKKTRVSITMQRFRYNVYFHPSTIQYFETIMNSRYWR